MPLDKPNPAPNFHQISPMAIQGLHPVNRMKGGPPRTFTANAGGSTTTILGPDADATDWFVGDRFRLYTSANVLKQNQLFTVTVKGSGAGTTTLTFTPAASGATASGDYISNAQDISDFGANFTTFQSWADIDAALIALGGKFTQAYVNTMTPNDKIHALNMSRDPEMNN